MSVTFLPPPAGACPHCALFHEDDEPHDPQSPYYRSHFYAEHARWPTWADAIAHCSDEMHDIYRMLLVPLGAEIPAR